MTVKNSWHRTHAATPVQGTPLLRLPVASPNRLNQHWQCAISRLERQGVRIPRQHAIRGMQTGMLPVTSALTRDYERRRETLVKLQQTVSQCMKQVESRKAACSLTLSA